MKNMPLRMRLCKIFVCFIHSMVSGYLIFRKQGSHGGLHVIPKRIKREVIIKQTVPTAHSEGLGLISLCLGIYQATHRRDGKAFRVVLRLPFILSLMFFINVPLAQGEDIIYVTSLGYLPMYSYYTGGYEPSPYGYDKAFNTCHEAALDAIERFNPQPYHFESYEPDGYGMKFSVWSGTLTIENLEIPPLNSRYLPNLEGASSVDYRFYVRENRIEGGPFIAWNDHNHSSRCESAKFCPMTNEYYPDGVFYLRCSCPKNKVMVGPVEELQDGCHNGCAVINLSPTESDKWVSTLQGVTTGATCTDTIISGVKPEKMLACGTAGNSSYSTKTAHPVDFAIGNKFFRDTDYRGSGGLPIVFGRTYNSYNLGWRFTYTQRIESLSPDKVAVHRPGGQSFEFTLNGTTWTPDPDVVERLEWLPEANGGTGGWRYTLANNSHEFFDANGRLMEIRNAAGLEQTLSYSADGKEMTIRDPNGDALTVTLNESGLLPVSITDKKGRTTSYTFDGVQLQQVAYPSGTSKQYLYEKSARPWLITGIIDENGHRSHTVDYDEQGRAIMSELADGADRVDINYNSDGTTTLTNALGKTTRFHFQTIHGVRKIIKVEGEPTATCQGTAMAYQFDDNGFLTEKTDAEGITTRFTRDGHGLELSRTEAVGLPVSRTISTEWDSELRKPLVVTKANSETRYSYDSEGRTQSRTLIDRTTGAKRSTGYTYNDLGLLESVDGPREDVADITTYRYDTDGRLTRVTNALGHVTEIVSRDDYGRPITTRDANGLETTLTYDEKGRIKSRTVGGETTAMTYDAVGNLIKVTAPDGTYLNYRYDNANRLIAIEDNSGNTISYTLDAMGNKKSEKVTDSHGQLTRTQQKTYDELGRLLTSVGANGQTTSYGYDRNDNLTRTIDPLWQVYENAYDGLNRLIEQTDPRGGITAYGYDAEDRLIQVTDPNGNATTYDYDGLGNLTAQHSPDTGTTRYTHDAAGNVLSKLDAKSQTTTYRYDALNRLTQTTYADGSTVSYTYDNAENGIGRLGKVIDAGGETTWQYDLQGHITARLQTIQLDGYVTQLATRYHYNSARQLSGITYPSGMVVGYDYADGKISAITINGESLLSAITYQPFGPISGWSWSNGSQSLRGYDLDGRLISQRLGRLSRNLTYDANGNITAITDPVNNQLFDYDALNRLKAANDSSFNLSWDYDANGNRLSETAADNMTSYSIDNGSNRLMAVDDTAYQYDANGNLIQDGVHSYQYNAQNRLIRVDDGATGEYRYNALGQRIYKKGVAIGCDVNGDGTVDQSDLHAVNGKNGSAIEAEGPGKGEAKGKGQSVACIATNIGAYANHGQGKGVENKAPGGSREALFNYDGHRLLGEYDTQGSAIQETVWLGNLPVATLQNGNVYDIHTDHLGTPRVITDSSNTEVWRWDSDPFGVAFANEDPDGDGQVVTYNLRFPGQYYDAETGKHYNYFRDYDPSTGRYIESDPIGLNGGGNTYGYVDGDPLSYVDYFGLAYSPVGEHGAQNYNLFPYSGEDCNKLKDFIENQEKVVEIIEDELYRGIKHDSGEVKEVANMLFYGCYTNLDGRGPQKMCIVHEGEHWLQVPASLLKITAGEFDKSTYYLFELDAYKASLETGKRIYAEECSCGN